MTHLVLRTFQSSHSKFRSRMFFQLVINSMEVVMVYKKISILTGFIRFWNQIYVLRWLSNNEAFLQHLLTTSFYLHKNTSIVRIQLMIECHLKKILVSPIIKSSYEYTEHGIWIYIENDGENGSRKAWYVKRTAAWPKAEWYIKAPNE